MTPGISLSRNVTLRDGHIMRRRKFDEVIQKLRHLLSTKDKRYARILLFSLIRRSYDRHAPLEIVVVEELQKEGLVTWFETITTSVREVVCATFSIENDDIKIWEPLRKGAHPA